MIGYKGFDKDFKCNGFQFEVGKTYMHKGGVELCESGFHFCEQPIDVLDYYNTRFAIVECENVSKEKEADSKRVCQTITIKEEISLHSLIETSVKYTFDNDQSKKENHNTIKGGAASATGYSGAASATGDSGAASATGYRGAASATGAYSIACGLGIECKARGVVGCWLVLAERVTCNNDWILKSVKSVKVDGKKIRENVWYILKNGKFTKAE